MAKEGAGGLRQCLQDIARSDTSGDYEKAVRAANQLIRKYPKEIYAFKCKLVALIQLSRWEDALNLCKKTPPGQMGPIHMEKAYIHYRLNDNDAALKELESCEDDDIHAMELKAQIFYRLDRFQEAYDLYKYLLVNHSDGNDDERKANMVAVQAHLANRGVITEVSEDTLETFEQLYNGACYHLEKEEYPTALRMLNEALPLCRQCLSESGLSPEEIEEEASAVLVQRAFALHQMSNPEAAGIYEKVLSINPSDQSVLAATLNNISVSSNFNLADFRKKLKSTSHVDQSKLSRRQRMTLAFNKALVLLLSNQREAAKKSLEELKAGYGSSRESDLLEAAIEWKEGSGDRAVSGLSTSDSLSLLSRIHILVNSNHFDLALKDIKSLPPSTQSAPATVALSVQLLRSLGKTDQAIALLKDFTKNCTGETKKRALNQLASLETETGNGRGAAAALEELGRHSPDDVSILCRLITAYSTFDTAKANSLREKNLPASETICGADELEESDWILYGEKYKQKKEAKTELEDTEIVSGKLRKRRRKRKIMPKNFDEKNEPDPERWMPKQERTAYKKKRKNKDRDVGRGTQGSTGSPLTVEYKPVTASPSTPLPALPAEGPRKNQPAKKKGRRGK